MIDKDYISSDDFDSQKPETCPGKVTLIINGEELGTVTFIKGKPDKRVVEVTLDGLVLESRDLVDTTGRCEFVFPGQHSISFDALIVLSSVNDETIGFLTIVTLSPIGSPVEHLDGEAFPFPSVADYIAEGSQWLKNKMAF